MLAYFGEISDNNVTLWKVRHNAQFASHCLYESAEIADIHIGSFFHLGNRRLINLQRLSQCSLSKSASFSQFVQRHFLAQFSFFVFNTRPALGTHFGTQIGEVLTSAHGSNPSSLNSAK